MSLQNHSNPPLVSIIMGVYINNTREQLERSLGSLLQQDYRPLELSLVFDGPVTPDVENFVSEFSRNTSLPVTLTRFAENRGLGPVLNASIQAAKGEFLARMDADDFSDSDRISKQIHYLLGHPEVDVVGCPVEEIYENDRQEVPPMPQTHEDCVKAFIWRNPINHPTAVFRKRFFEKAGLYRENTPCDEDSALWLDAMKAGCIFANISDCKHKMIIDNDFYKRRKKFSSVLMIFKVRLEIVQALGFGLKGYAIAALKSLTMLLPVSLFKHVYKIKKKLWGKTALARR